MATAHVPPVWSGHVALVHYRGPVVVEGPVGGLGWRPGVAAVVAGAGVGAGVCTGVGPGQ